ncbi:three-Cys-motif partner protein TcmP [Rhizobium leguminosarum]|uniref:three-Cys-motif partner protein TcmP n=1 Tax=Rhizobium leguminosarum TaxID=384 RepID=UPI002F951D8A
MGELIDGDDGLPAEEVGEWAKEKHAYLCRYIDISKAARAKYLGPGKGGAAFIDLFCGPGRCRVKSTGEWIDGGAVAAWNKSVQGGQPFSRVIVADADQERLDATIKRLQNAGAPVVSACGPASLTAFFALQRTPPHGLNFAFLDPYNLEALDFKIFETLARVKRLDVLVHLSKMDLQRNLDINIGATVSAFDAFAPGWRDVINVGQAQGGIRTEVIEHWRDIVGKVGMNASRDVRLLKGSRGQHLYWLLLLASHDLALKFWKVASNPEKQGSLF